MSFYFVFFFFFSSRRRHTRCLSDWSSDVCSSDLSESCVSPVVLGPWEMSSTPTGRGLPGSRRIRSRTREKYAASSRSEERRVGKECRSRWCEDQYRQKKRTGRDARTDEEHGERRI